MNEKLCLGTAQFGLDYGITNKDGRVTDDEIKKILLYAVEKGIYRIDTAQNYGIAEQTIGKLWPKQTKLWITSKNQENAKQCEWDKKFEETLRKLNTNKINTYLIHNTKDLKKENGEDLIRWLRKLKEKNFVEKIGVSIYEEKDLCDIPEDLMEVVQLPLSLYDQRFAKYGLIKKLKEEGKEINVRSIFMQGLILTEPNKWPSFINRKFRHHHKKMWTNKSKMLEACMSYIRTQKEVDACLIGVLSQEELSHIVMKWEKLKEPKTINYEDWAWNNHNDIDPRKWPRK